MTVVNLLRDVEMNHILLIDYCLFNKYPEILRIQAIRDNMSKYNQALSYLASLPTDEWLYINLIRPRSDTNVLKRNNFVMLSSAAFAAAKYENPSMRNYRGGQETAAGGYVDKVVTTYLNVRTNMSIMSMVRSPYAYLSSTERSEVARESEHTKNNNNSNK
jgi:hypothetical protein